MWFLDHEENLLASPRGYETNIQKFLEFLDGAKTNFEMKN